MSLQIEPTGDALVLSIDRPKTRNALDRDLTRRLAEAVRVAEADPTVRGIVLTATGEETFVSGGDLHEISRAVRGGAGPSVVLDMYEDLAVLETSELPVVAAVQGNVYGGGCELLLLCDMVILEAHASLAFRHARMGLSPAWGGLTRLVERVGPIEAPRLMFSAERIGAEEAARLGLVNEVVPKGTSRERALARIGRIAESARAVVAAQKRALTAVRMAMRGDAIERERAIFAEVWGGEAHRAALDAFFKRRG
ncbi:enoyl-CoA hydratase/isomerase family protein [Polyangium sp. y55x31]|uniref:enoyl-CoA hydratase/isomerase family protein n=1 Tax=Polyangium sp. y55x31 TaxID=3042688 RepID=UPI0024824EC2|nr:enoyl-CoA hydratase/isomerase family protein [Polyangium sp. y55x31]MDI1477377.1 enoyl-CoA hydratase/isomerase family protein [Polyangium sp. y55x31]